MSSKASLKRFGVGVGLYALLFFTFYLYQQAFHGPFVFDDIPNLSPLRYFGGVTSWQSALYFIFGGDSGPLGRPLSLATFLINDNAWPSNPEGFKYTNALIHLVNVVLVYLVGRELARLLAVKADRQELFALLAAAIWAVHPIHVSAVTFVIQRMTLLSSLFELLVIFVFIRGRPSWSWALDVVPAGAIIAFFALLGVLSKETAVSVVFFVAVIEVLFFQHLVGTRRLVGGVLGLGAICIVGYMVYGAAVADVAWSRRNFTLGQRLITEARVTADYAINFFMPRPSRFSLFNDDYRVSQSVFSDWSAAVSVIGWSVVIVLGWFCRNKYKIVTLAIFWFLSGHILESTILPLELYFDHRNYLPVLGTCWLVAFFITNMPRAVPAFLLASVVVALMAFVSSSVLKVWTSESMMARIWGQEHPASPRAQQMLVRDLIAAGDSSGAVGVTKQVLSVDPENLHLLLQKLILECLTDSEIQLGEYLMPMERYRYSTGVKDGLNSLQTLAVSGGCPPVGAVELRQIYDAFLKNPSYGDGDTVAFFQFKLAELAERERDLNRAMQHLDLAYAANPTNIQFPLMQFGWLLSAGLLDDAERYLKIAAQTNPPHRLQRPKYDEAMIAAWSNFYAVRSQVKGMQLSPGKYDE